MGSVLDNSINEEMKADFARANVYTKKSVETVGQIYTYIY